MQGADVREYSGVRESDAETCYAKGRLWQPTPFLWCRDDEPGVSAVGSRSNDGVPGAILAVPMLAITKIVCDDLRPLRAFGHFLEA